MDFVVQSQVFTAPLNMCYHRNVMCYCSLYDEEYLARYCFVFQLFFDVPIQMQV